MTTRVTPKQRRAAELMVENGRSSNPKTKGEILLEAGYSEAIATTPTDVTESNGFKKALDEMGLTDDLIVNALVEDIKLKKGRRLPELALAAKIKGLDRGGDVSQTPHTVNNTQINITEQKIDDYTDYLKQRTIREQGVD